MRERLMGMENEFAFTATGPDGKRFDAADAQHMINARIKDCFPNLRAMQGGMFLANGGRLYLDCGHDEWCTAESTCPTMVVRHLLAGERMLASAAAALVREGKLGSAVFGKVNVDYSGTQSTWGSHESYHYDCDPGSLPRQLIPFLVSRVIFAGAGGFDPTSPSGCFFTLSPRVAFIDSVISGSSMHDRGIIHTKDEPLSATGGHRLHVLIGESLCSCRGNWLKLATTALCLGLAEAGLVPGGAVALHDPVQALRMYAADPACKATARGVDGRDLSALDIQRHYLDLAGKHLDVLPGWAETAVAAWADILDKLARGPSTVGNCLDWVIKRLIFESHLIKAGFTWELLTWWSHVHSILRTCADALPERQRKAMGQLGQHVRRRGPLSRVARDLTPHLHARDMKWEQFDVFLKLRLELMELDTRFGQLGQLEGGLFQALDAAGVLAHGFPGVDRIEQAMNEPPDGRAGQRGAMIRTLHNLPHSWDRFECDWDRIIDHQKCLLLDLDEVSSQSQEWRTLPPADRERNPLVVFGTDSCPF